MWAAIFVVSGLHSEEAAVGGVQAPHSKHQTYKHQTCKHQTCKHQNNNRPTCETYRAERAITFLKNITLQSDITCCTHRTRKQLQLWSTHTLTWNYSHMDYDWLIIFSLTLVCSTVSSCHIFYNQKQGSILFFQFHPAYKRTKLWSILILPMLIKQDILLFLWFLYACYKCVDTLQVVFGLQNWQNGSLSS